MKKVKFDKQIVTRKQPKEIDKILNMMGRTIDDLVDFGSLIMNWIGEGERTTELDTPLYTSMMHVIDTLDSISSLTKKGSTSGVKALLRALFEASLHLRYMAKETREKGVIAYQVAHAYQEIEKRKLLDPNQEKGKAFIPLLKKQLLRPDEIETAPIEESAKYLYQFLSREDVKEVDSEYLRVKSKNRKRHPNWHALFNGPTSTRDLAAIFDMETIYVLLYNDLSRHIHGSGTMQLFKNAEGKAIVPGLRNADGLQQLVNWTIIVTLDMYRDLLQQINPSKSKEYGLWYLSKIKPSADLINGKPLFNITYGTA